MWGLRSVPPPRDEQVRRTIIPGALFLLAFWSWGGLEEEPVVLGVEIAIAILANPRLVAEPNLVRIHPVIRRGDDIGGDLLSLLQRSLAVSGSADPLTGPRLEDLLDYVAGPPERQAYFLRDLVNGVRFARVVLHVRFPRCFDLFRSDAATQRRLPVFAY